MSPPRPRLALVAQMPTDAAALAANTPDLPPEPTEAVPDTGSPGSTAQTPIATLSKRAHDTVPAPAVRPFPKWILALAAGATVVTVVAVVRRKKKKAA